MLIDGTALSLLRKVNTRPIRACLQLPTLGMATIQIRFRVQVRQTFEFPWHHLGAIMVTTDRATVTRYRCRLVTADKTVVIDHRVHVGGELTERHASRSHITHRR